MHDDPSFFLEVIPSRSLGAKRAPARTIHFHERTRRKSSMHTSQAPTTSTPNKSNVQNPYESPRLNKENTSPDDNGHVMEVTEHLTRARIPTKKRSAIDTTAESSPKNIPKHLSCPRCGLESNQETLCILWHHHGDEEPLRDVHAFRYTCCGNQDPHPCFVGNHAPPGDTRSSPRRGVGGLVAIVQCHCSERAAFRRTHSPQSPNQGRYYYSCRSPKPIGCDFFAWADTIHGITRKEQPALPSDGVRDWLLPQANPLGEGILTPQDRSKEKDTKRFLAAVMIQWILRQIAHGKTHITLQDMFDHVVHWVRSQHIQDYLHDSLTYAQIEARIGAVPHLEAPNPDELVDIWRDILSGNPVLRSTVPSTSPDQPISLQGLRTYFYV